MKITKTENWRVEVRPELSYLVHTMSEESLKKEMRDRCDSIVHDIKRHIDGLGSVHVDCDVKTECEHCGIEWLPAGTGHLNEGCNGCCDKEIAEWEARTGDIYA